MRKYNMSKIMKNAWVMVKKFGVTISEGLKAAWKVAKKGMETIKETVNEVNNVVVEHFYSYNVRRYSTPWVCEVVNGKHDFSKEIGTYTANKGEEGDIVIFAPEVGKVYAYGQKDYRGSNTVKNFVTWNGAEFVACDKLGR